MATARIALVTGGMGGLGEAICLKLAALVIRQVPEGHQRLPRHEREAPYNL